MTRVTGGDERRRVMHPLLRDGSGDDIDRAGRALRRSAWWSLRHPDRDVTVDLGEATRALSDGAEFEHVFHEARSAVLAIDAAVRALAASLDPADAPGARLAGAASAELARLRAMLTPPETRPVVRRAFTLADRLTPVITCFQAMGMPIRVDIPPMLRVDGDPDVVAEVVHNLLDNARRHARGSSVCVRARHDVGTPGTVTLAVEDRGPGIRFEDRSRIFGRGVRLAAGATEGEGFGLYLARRLMLGQGGDLRVDDRLGGGVSFVLTLAAVPPPPAPSVAAERVDEVDESGDVPHVDLRDALGSPQ